MSNEKKVQRPLNLAFVDLEGSKFPKSGKLYKCISPSNDKLFDLPYPEESEFKRINIDLFDLYIRDLPDITKKNEGLLKISVDTRDPGNLENPAQDANSVIDFVAKDGQYAPGFLFKGLYRNVVFTEWINFRVDLFEIDKDPKEGYDKIKTVIDGVPELKSLDILKGIPYVGLATKLFDTIITKFGKNRDDHIWGSVPLLELEPVPGGAFLRSGIYIIYEKKTSPKNNGREIKLDSLRYKDGKFHNADASIGMSNHLVFGVKIKHHS